MRIAQIRRHLSTTFLLLGLLGFAQFTVAESPSGCITDVDTKECGSGQSLECFAFDGGTCTGKAKPSEGFHPRTWECTGSNIVKMSTACDCKVRTELVWYAVCIDSFLDVVCCTTEKCVPDQPGTVPVPLPPQSEVPNCVPSGIVVNRYVKMKTTKNCYENH